MTRSTRRWPREGVPGNPRAWLISTARFKAIDAIRRRARFDASQASIAESLYAGIDDLGAAPLVDPPRRRPGRYDPPERDPPRSDGKAEGLTP